MIPVPAAVVDTAKKMVEILSSSDYKRMSEEKKNGYELELTNVICKTIEKYEQNYTAFSKGSVPFYHSELLLEYFKFCLNKNVDIFSIQQKFQMNRRIIIPTADELKTFLKVFYEHISMSDKIRELNFEYYYKKEILEISEAIDHPDNKFNQHTKSSEQMNEIAQIPEVEFKVFIQRRYPNSKDLAEGLFLDIMNHSSTITVNKIKVTVSSEPIGNYNGFSTLFTTFGDLLPGEKQRFEAIHEYEKIISDCLRVPINLCSLITNSGNPDIFNDEKYEKYPVTVSIEFLPQLLGATLIKRKDQMFLVVQRT